MNHINDIDCIDSGTENCPCYLAATGDCPVCSRLHGKEYCDCLWNGVCIYNEFVQNNYKVNNPRKDFTARIISKEQYSEDLYLITLDVGRGFALKAAAPGSYVFLQAPGLAEYYHAPISVMSVSTDIGYITVLVKSISAKTKALCNEEEKLVVRGVYRGGLCGMSLITGRFGRIIQGSKVLILTKGVGFAPAVNFINWAGSTAEIEVISDGDKISPKIIEDFLPKSLVRDYTIGSLQEWLDHGLNERILTGSYTAVVVLASDYYISEIRSLVLQAPTPPHFVCSNNVNICCGEGICGACSCVDSQGNVCKRCKCM